MSEYICSNCKMSFCESIRCKECDRAFLEPKEKAEVERLKEDLHYTTGCCNLAMKHRDEAEKEVERLTHESADYREKWEAGLRCWDNCAEMNRELQAKIDDEIEWLKLYDTGGSGFDAIPYTVTHEAIKQRIAILKGGDDGLSN